MNEKEIRTLLIAGLRDSEIELQAEGNKISLVLVTEQFSGLSRVKRQQLVYKLLDQKISSGEIHAVTMRCLTPAERNNVA
ncbi:MAG: BolA/IbaG family iron-sulfur metabolism protein [SAR86 cluster bacterium]|jgi:acid stress-induced BolA-like protein IbaG/YrbA|uniref:BolA/IbaG family iron-sulfur metabolism protein n=1 Tax=SAR86 cluster bacterium TaxID=2030880 RepID=A0A973A7W0_9GAMM|nr:BolA/IbaG family iron-sulfur metabolism protein [SAR86 cluster bacterium]|tara:strand:+ start:30565 stop:30804 length:240 start_codon:yes stop_codon:yes gene_type:complete